MILKSELIFRHIQVRQELYGKNEQSYSCDSSPMGISTGCLHLQVVFCTLLSTKFLVNKWDWWNQECLTDCFCLSLQKDFPDSKYQHAGIYFLWTRWYFRQLLSKRCMTKKNLSNFWWVFYPMNNSLYSQKRLWEDAFINKTLW